MLEGAIEAVSRDRHADHTARHFLLPDPANGRGSGGLRSDEEVVLCPLVLARSTGWNHAPEGASPTAKTLAKTAGQPVGWAQTGGWRTAHGRGAGPFLRHADNLGCLLAFSLLFSTVQFYFL